MSARWMGLVGLTLSACFITTAAGDVPAIVRSLNREIVGRRLVAARSAPAEVGEPTPANRAVQNRSRSVISLAQRDGQRPVHFLDGARRTIGHGPGRWRSGVA